MRNTVKAKVMEATLIILEYRMELNRRRAMYDQLARSYPGLTGIPPQLLRDLRIYGGYQGIYYDKANTSALVGGQAESL